MDELVIKALSLLFMVYGIIFTGVLLFKLFKEKEQLKKEQGKPLRMMIEQFIVYFLCALGFPDFVMNTIVFEKSGWVESNRLSQTIVISSVTPSTIIVCSYLMGSSLVDSVTLLITSIAVFIGGLIGSGVAGRTNGAIIRKILAVALAVSMVAIAVRLYLNSGITGTETALTAPKLIVAVPLFILLGVFNAFGVPMKPTATAILLIMGISPMSTLTYMLVLTFIGPGVGSVRYLKQGNYNRKYALAATTIGSVGAVIGIRLALNLNAMVMTVLMLIIMAFAFFMLIRKK